MLLSREPPLSFGHFPRERDHCKTRVGTMRAEIAGDVPVCPAPLDSGFRRNDVVFQRPRERGKP